MEVAALLAGGPRRDQSILRAALPEKHEFVVFCPLSTLQRRTYDTFRTAFLRHRWNGKRSLLAYIAAVNKIGGHPDLLRDFLRRQQAKGDPQATIWFKHLSSILGPQYVPGRVSDSPKMMVLLRVFQHLMERSEKLLVFSQYVQSLNAIEAFMVKLVPDLPRWRLDGSLSSAVREKAIADFQKHTSSGAVFLISTKAGGVGINLCTAHRAILFDVSFNPANDQQAIFRLYRYGLKHPVSVYRLVAEGTPEAYVYQTCLSKEWTARKVVDDEAPTRDHVTHTDLSGVWEDLPALVGVEEEDPTLRARLADERVACFHRDPLLADVCSWLDRRGWSVRRVHRHESLFIDDTAAAPGDMERVAYQRFLQQGGSNGLAPRRGARSAGDEGELDFIASTLEAAPAGAAEDVGGGGPVETGAAGTERPAAAWRSADLHMTEDERLEVALALSKADCSGQPPDAGADARAAAADDDDGSDESLFDFEREAAEDAAGDFGAEAALFAALCDERDAAL
eukprot:TRINITY_DN5617_c4_g1_i2.p2 TRINITY_DN5617_c4_g1~~TRINITY_DN5617_c4_g1_i2.p2  ORF type:complete len:509 (+),score=196.18 TRINITY_DN5617_c4_g1_i2:1477-3003(+)